MLHDAASIKDQWNGQIVFVGEPLSRELRALAERLQIADRLVEVPNADNELLEALYNRAVALLYPSRFEGFGWPVIEAQACGCPVICSTAGPLPEVKLRVERARFLQVGRWCPILRTEQRP